MSYIIEYSREGGWSNAVGTFMDVRQGNYDTEYRAYADMYFASINNPTFTFRLSTIHGYRINGESC